MSKIYRSENGEVRLLAIEMRYGIVLIELLDSGNLMFVSGVTMKKGEMKYKSATSYMVTKKEFFHEIRMKKMRGIVGNDYLDKYYKIPRVHKKMIMDAFEMEMGEIIYGI